VEFNTEISRSSAAVACKKSGKEMEQVKVKRSMTKRFITEITGHAGYLFPVERRD